MKASTATHEQADRATPAAQVTRLRTRPAPVPQEAEQLADVVPMPPRPGMAGTKPAPLSVAAAADPEPADARSFSLESRRVEAALVAQMAKKIATAALEVLSGSRQVQQLARWLDHQSFEALSVRTQLTRAAEQVHGHHGTQNSSQNGNVHALHRNPVVHSVHCSRIAPGIYETSLVVAEQARVRAMAIRFEESNGIWKVAALQIG